MLRSSHREPLRLAALTAGLCGLTLIAFLPPAPALADAGAPAALQDPALPALPRSKAEATRIRGVVAAPDDFSAPEPFEAMPGGAATSRKRPNQDAFSQSSANMPFERELDFKLGNGLFRKLWVSAPSSTRASDGLGPLYNARSCQRCHLKDGRGHPPMGEG